MLRTGRLASFLRTRVMWAIGALVHLFKPVAPVAPVASVAPVACAA